MGAVFKDMRRLAVGERDIEIGIVAFLYARIQFRAIHQSAELVQFRDIDKFPLHEFLILVEKSVFFALAERHRFFIGLFGIGGFDQPQLFVELGNVCALTADDLKNEF